MRLDRQVLVGDAVPSVSNLPISPDDIREGIKDLQSILDFIGKYSNVLDGVAEVTQKFAKVNWFASHRRSTMVSYTHLFFLTDSPHC